ncbi:GGDEF domain-containing protein [Mycobacterium sp. MYCO198283]|uniref:GGDEF domain-containing protein n=1 Tax=Mycobacterium sp. MYCO198283 TaxID=2883505 RepID=UPI001E3055F3|nr:GGDEF domain-containing protein [Mycobacterium sp. MYCO198283]MCG5433665.1 GGDEF domain-containing protein [Mycobacterium sp. MYCO198283]
MEWIGRWWRRPDHYRWLSDFLTARGAQRLTRRTVALLTVLLGVVPFALLFSPVGPHGPAARVVSVAVTGACVVMALLWWRYWPTHRQSVQYLLIANACIVAAVCAQPDPSVALAGCAAFAALCGYVGFFHTGAWLTLTLTTALTTAIGCAVRLADRIGAVAAVAELVVVLIAVLVIPWAGQVLVHLLTRDASRSDTDALTGLHNRRGFTRELRRLLADPPAAAAHLTVVMVDIDDFKTVNDTHGHARGDRTLTAVADTLRRHVRHRAVVARFGGEEFCIASLSETDSSLATAEGLRTAIAAAVWPVTASLGVAAAALPAAGLREREALVGGLIEAADASMYEAKRAGGNRIRHAGAARVRTS